ncbi:MAG: hypothetical protein PHE24_02220 [Patescibacteria group bacterium]|nr:hypothetical protein [Patescibacteria group bacterium]
MDDPFYNLFFPIGPMKKTVKEPGAATISGKDPLRPFINRAQQEFAGLFEKPIERVTVKRELPDNEFEIISKRGEVFYIH